MQGTQDQIRCGHCGGHTYRIPYISTTTQDVYRCLNSSKHLTYVPKAGGQRIPVSGPTKPAA